MFDHVFVGLIFNLVGCFEEDVQPAKIKYKSCISSLMFKRASLVQYQLRIYNIPEGVLIPKSRRGPVV